MTPTPLFSILIANYNNGKYLMEAVESVRQQTYTRWEIILVDDASTDNSRDLYGDLEKDDRIHIYYNDVNHGCGYTKRRCAELANGEICGFLDPDDALLPKALEQHVEVYQNNDNAAIVYSNCYLCDNNLNVVWEHRMQPISNGESFFSTHQYCGPAHFASYKNACYKQTEGICCYPAGVDQDLYLKVEEKGQAYVLDEFTYLWREVKDSVCRKDRWKTVYWNLLVLHDTCVRRGLNDSDYALVFLKEMALLAKKEGSAQKEQELKSTRAYRLGKFLLSPITKAKRICNKLRNK